MRLRVLITVLAALFALVSSAGGAAAEPPPGETAATPLNTNPSPAPGQYDNDHIRHVRLRPGLVPERNWDCAAGYSCYFAGRNGTGRRWVAPSCGFFNLGQMHPPFNDTISSIWNRGGGAIGLYNWDGRSRWIYLGTVPIGARGNLPPEIDDIVDAVDIAC